MAFTPTDVRLGGSFVQDLSGFQRDTLELGSFFAGKAREKSVSKALSEVDALDADGKPVLNKRGTFKAADRAFNEASVKAYQAAVQNDAMESVSRIEDENPDNPEAFQAAMDGFKEGFLGGIEQSVRPNIISLLDNLESAARINVNSAFRTRVNEESKVKLEKTQAKFKDLATAKQFEGDLIGAEAARILYLDSLDNPLLTPTEKAESMIALDKDLDDAQFLGGIDKLNDENPELALAAISNFENADPTTLGISPERQAELAAKGIASIGFKAKIAEALETQGDDERKRLQIETASDLSVDAFEGSLTLPSIISALDKRQITSTQADQLIKRMNSTYSNKDNANTVVELQRNLPSLSKVENELAINNAINDGSITASTANALQKAVNSTAKTEEDQRVSIKRNLLVSLTKPLTGPASAWLDPGGEARAGFAIAEFNERVLNGEDFGTVFNEVLAASTQGDMLALRNIPELKIGSRNDTAAARKLVTQSFSRGEITRDEANVQLTITRMIDSLKLRSEEVDKLLKDSKASQR